MAIVPYTKLFTGLDKPLPGFQLAGAQCEKQCAKKFKKHAVFHTAPQLTKRLDEASLDKCSSHIGQENIGPWSFIYGPPCAWSVQP